MAYEYITISSAKHMGTLNGAKGELNIPTQFARIILAMSTYTKAMREKERKGTSMILGESHKRGV